MKFMLREFFSYFTHYDVILALVNFGTGLKQIMSLLSLLSIVYVC